MSCSPDLLGKIILSFVLGVAVMATIAAGMAQKVLKNIEAINEKNDKNVPR